MKNKKRNTDVVMKGTKNLRNLGQVCHVARYL